MDVSRAASLPPVSIDSLHRRRPSVSSTYNGPVRATSQRYASPALPTIRAGESVAGYRRASYSGISPNYRPRSVSRHTTPDRSTVDYWQRGNAYCTSDTDENIVL